MLVNLARCMRYWDDLSVTQLLVRCMRHLKASQERQTSRVVCFGLLILSPEIVPNMSVYRPDSLFQDQLGVQRSYPCRS